MQNSALYSILSGEYMLFAIAVTRMATVFLVLPVFSSQLIPPLVRNSLFVALTLSILSIQMPIETSALSSVELFKLFMSESFAGIAIGIFFGLFLWAFEAAGEVIDTAVGSSQAMVFDPISGHEVTLIGEFLARWANYLFMAAGGMFLVTLAVLQSYSVWPLGQTLPSLDMASSILFEQEFARVTTLILMIAAPALVVIFLIDMAMGLINRFAQQLNVSFLSMSLKYLATLVLLVALLPILSSLFVSELEKSNNQVIERVKSVLSVQ